MARVDRLFRVLEEARRDVLALEEWQRSPDTNKTLRAIAEERRRQREDVVRDVVHVAQEVC